MPLSVEEKHENRIRKILENTKTPWNSLRLPTIKSKKLKPQFCLLRRLQEADDQGYCICVTCGCRRRFNDYMDGGHWVHGTSPSLLVRENINPQCRDCNGFANVGGLYDAYMAKHYSEDRLEHIRSLKFCKHEWTRREMAELYIHWAELIKVEKQRIGA